MFYHTGKFVRSCMILERSSKWNEQLMHLWKQIEKVWLKNDKDKCIFLACEQALSWHRSMSYSWLSSSLIQLSYSWLSSSLVTSHKRACSQASIFPTDRRNLNIWITEHKQATKNCDLNKNISEHHIKPKHIRLNQKAISKFPSASFSKRG